MLDFLFVETGVEDCQLMVTGLGPLSDGSMSIADAKLAPKSMVMVSQEEDSEEEDEE